MSHTTTSKAIEAGLTYRPLADTVRTLYDWWVSDAVLEERRIKMASGENAFQAREAAIIKKWKSK